MAEPSYAYPLYYLWIYIYMRVAARCLEHAKVHSCSPPTKDHVSPPTIPSLEGSSYTPNHARNGTRRDEAL